MIGEKCYRVLDDDKQAGTHRPEPFVYTDSSGKSVQGWRFDAEEITETKIIKLINKHKLACLVLNQNYVKEVKTTAN